MLIVSDIVGLHDLKKPQTEYDFNIMRMRRNANKNDVKFTLFANNEVEIPQIEVEFIGNTNNIGVVSVVKDNTMECSCSEYSQDKSGCCIHIAAVMNLYSLKNNLEHTIVQKQTNKIELEIFFVDLLKRLYNTSKKNKSYVYYDSLNDEVRYIYGEDKTDLVYLPSMIKHHHLIKDDVKQKDVITSNLDDILLGVNLYNYQRDCLHFMLENKRAINALPVGYGKTLTAIAAMKYVINKRDIYYGVITCPKSLKIQWTKEIHKYIPDVKIFNVSTLIEFNAFLHSKEKYKVCITSYQFITRNIKLFKNMPIDMYIFDEIQYIKNSDSKSWNAFKKLNAEYMYGLSGTTIENELGNLFNVIDVIKPYHFGPRWVFNSKYHIIDGITWNNIFYSDNLKNIDDLKKEIFSVMFYLPDNKKIKLRKNDIYVTMSQEQRDMSNTIMDTLNTYLAMNLGKFELTDQIKGVIQSLFLKARLAANDLRLLDNSGVYDVSPKVLRIQEMIDDFCFKQGKKVVVFSEWKKMIDLCASGLEKENYIVYNGDLSEKQRNEAIYRFVNDDDCFVFFATDAAGVGVDGLQFVSNIVIHTELPYNPARLDQRNGRLHRNKQENDVDVYYVVSENSIETDKIEGCLQRKISQRTSILSSNDDTTVRLID